MESVRRLFRKLTTIEFLNFRARRRSHQIEKVMAQQLIGLVAHKRFNRLVDENEVTATIGAIDYVANMLNQLLESLFRLAQRVLGTVSLGHSPQDQDEQKSAAQQIEDDSKRCQCVDMAESDNQH